MVCVGHIKDGTVILDEPLNAPDGTVVRVEFPGEDFTLEDDENERPSFCERYQAIMGIATHLPPDAAENHDERMKSHSLADTDDIPSFAERFAEFLGGARDLPEDAAENHDHYLYGVPKK